MLRRRLALSIDPHKPFDSPHAYGLASQPADLGIPNRLNFNSSHKPRVRELSRMARKRPYRSKFRADVIRNRMTGVSGKNGHCREITDLRPTRQGTQTNRDQKHDRNKRVAKQDSRIVIFNFAFGDVKVRMFKDCHGLDLQKTSKQNAELGSIEFGATFVGMLPVKADNF
jgi:hypothetical protein